MRVIVCLAVAALFSLLSPLNITVDAREQQQRVPTSESEVKLTFAPVVKQVSPSVVNVYAARRVVNRSPFAGDPFFERFFGRGFSRPRNQNSLGSGVIVSKTGVVITNFHVIRGADEVRVALFDGREFTADIVLKDEASDLAVLQIQEDGNFQPIDIGNSEDAQVGDLVLAIGNPFGVGQTVTSGIVSAVARSQQGISDFGFFLQTDAAINPGNSGGALVDMEGRLIGINTAIFSRSGGSNGIGFAIPSNMVQVAVASAQIGDVLQRPWIGASFQEVTPEIAVSLGLERPRGALVTGVENNGPAASAGIRVGDVLVTIDGKELSHVDALDYRLTTLGIGRRTDATILRKGKPVQIALELIAAPETVPANETRIEGRSALAGAVIANLSPALSQRLKLPNSSRGVVVMEVPRNSFAAANRLRAGDILQQINGARISNVKEVISMADQAGRRWVIELQRAGRTLVLDRNGNFFRQYSR